MIELSILYNPFSLKLKLLVMILRMEPRQVYVSQKEKTIPRNIEDVNTISLIHSKGPFIKT